MVNYPIYTASGSTTGSPAFHNTSAKESDLEIFAEVGLSAMREYAKVIGT